MSHTVTVKIEFKNKEILAKVCKKLGYQLKTGHHKVSLYDGTTDADMSVTIPGWRFPVAITADNEAKYDNYNGSWGKMSDFEKLQQEYASAVTLEEAQAMGYLSQQEFMPDGSIRIELYR